MVQGVATVTTFLLAVVLVPAVSGWRWADTRQAQSRVRLHAGTTAGPKTPNVAGGEVMLHTFTGSSFFTQLGWVFLFFFFFGGFFHRGTISFMGVTVACAGLLKRL